MTVTDRLAGELMVVAAAHARLRAGVSDLEAELADVRERVRVLEQQAGIAPRRPRWASPARRQKVTNASTRATKSHHAG